MSLPKELRALVGNPVLPFIGAGLAVEAGVPPASGLAALLRDRGGLDESLPADLVDITSALEAEIGIAPTEELVRTVIGELTVSATPTLTALAGCPGRRILTTNYDDAIEQSVRQAGLIPQSYERTSAQPLLPRPLGEVAVIHAHGMVTGSGPLVLPGKSTLTQSSDPAYQTALASLLAQQPVLYLGFRFGPGELALESVLAFLASRMSEVPPQFLLITRDDAEQRAEHLQTLKSTGLLTVLTYDEPEHDFVLKAALLLAPRADPVSGVISKRIDSPPPGYLAPGLIECAPDTDREELDRLTFGADYDWGNPLSKPDAVIAASRSLVLASPGMGKTELLHYLARDPNSPPAVVVTLKEVAAHLDSHAPPELAVAKALPDGRSGRPDVAVPTRESLDDSGFLFLLDGLDEVTGTLQPDVAAAVIEASERWDQHRWVITSRPIMDSQALIDAGFEAFRIWPSRSWVNEYLKGRGVPPDKLERLEQAGGFEDIVSIPLFAAAAADRLLDPDGAPLERPLDLLVDVQREGAQKEVTKQAIDGDVFGWLKRLALGLEFRGRTDATVSELADVIGTGELEARSLREQLIRASLLAELPGLASFPRKTMQEALCAHTVLSSHDLKHAVEEFGMATVAGRRALRSDIEFTLELIWENGTHEQRLILRELDPLRWARTVITSGSEDDAGDAFDVIWAWHQQHPVWFSSMDETVIRTVYRAVMAIGNKWPGIIEARRDMLVEATRSPAPSDRYNAATALSSLGSSQDTDWLIPLLSDSHRMVARRAVEIVRQWQDSDLASALWDALEHAVPNIAEQIVIALGEVAGADQDELERVAREADKHHRVIRHLLPSLLSRMCRTRVVSLLAHWPSDLELWRHALSAGVGADSEPWSEDEVRQLVESILARGVSARDIVAVPALQDMLTDRADVVLDVLRDRAKMQPHNRSIQMLLSTLPASATDSHRTTGPLASYLANVDATPTPEVSPARSITMDERITREIDNGDINETHWRVELDWPRNLGQSQLQRLAELSAAWWPTKLLTDVRVHSDEPEDSRAVSAVSAGAAADAPLDRERWLQLFAATQLVDLVQNSYRWLAGHYSPQLESNVLELISQAPDGHVLSIYIASLPGIDPPFIDAFVERLGQLTDGGWWANAVGVLAQRGYRTELERLLDLELTEEQTQTLQRNLATQGNSDAQVAVLNRMLACARGGEQVAALHWPNRVTDERVVKLLGELHQILPRRATINNDPHRSIAGILSASQCEEAIAVYDELAALDDPDAPYYWFSQEGIIRRLASDRVLERLPDNLDELATFTESL